MRGSFIICFVNVTMANGHSFCMDFVLCTSDRCCNHLLYEDIYKSYRTGCLEPDLKMVQLSATRYNFIAILWVRLVSFAAITLCVASQRVFIVVVIIYFVIDSVRKLLDTHSYIRVINDLRVAVQSQFPKTVSEFWCQWGERSLYWWMCDWRLSKCLKFSCLMP
jgi:hypothetical protein